jgi:hypothetical protein
MGVGPPSKGVVRVVGVAVGEEKGYDACIGVDWLVCMGEG